MIDTAIANSLSSLLPGGKLAIGFFGGEPLLRSQFIQSTMDKAKQAVVPAEVEVTFGLTSNGTVHTSSARSLLMRTDLAVAISFDGTPELHDRHRKSSGGKVTASLVMQTISFLQEKKRPFKVVVTVRPDTVRELPHSLCFLTEHGINDIVLSLDLWTIWSESDISGMRAVIAQIGEVWLQQQPHLRIDWFDSKLALVLAPSSTDGFCRFGNGELAVAPSGRLYPCERLIGNDEEGNARCLPQQLAEVNSFVKLHPGCTGMPDVCRSCALAPFCNSYCRCSNYVRTGDAERPDHLLCEWNKACINAAVITPAEANSRLVKGITAPYPSDPGKTQQQKESDHE